MRCGVGYAVGLALAVIPDTFLAALRICPSGLLAHCRVALGKPCPMFLAHSPQRPRLSA